MGHLGSRVTALLDGRLTPAEEERAWDHVHACHPCRDAVEREGWVKTRLVSLGHCPTPSSPSLRETLLSVDPGRRPVYPETLPDTSPAPRHRHLVALGGSAVGVAVLGVVALGAAPANAPHLDRRGPVTSVVPPHSSPSPTPTPTSSVRHWVVRETIAP